MLIKKPVDETLRHIAIHNTTWIPIQHKHQSVEDHISLTREVRNHVLTIHLVYSLCHFQLTSLSRLLAQCFNKQFN